MLRRLFLALFLILLSAALLMFYLRATCQRILHREIRKIVSNAATELLIVDPYVDHTLWTLLTSIPPSVRVRILTDRTTADFSLEAKKFAAQHGNRVEIRQTKKYHDRFIVLDGNTCWHVGASIKDVGIFGIQDMQRILLGALALTGNKACTLSKFERADIENAWASSALAPI